MIAPANKRLWECLLWAGAASLLAVAQFRMVMLVIGWQSYVASIDTAKGVVTGHPYWLVFQSRVLAPYTVELLSNLFKDNFRLAHAFFTMATTAIAGFLILALATRRFGREAAWGAFLLFHLLFTLLLSKPWLYAWDHYGIIIFILFVHFVFCDKDWRWFAALFAVAIFNRESALFIAVWMILDPLIKFFLNRGQRARLNWTMLGGGLACMAAGIALILLLRTYLMVREVGPETFPDLTGKSVHIHLSSNVAFMKQVVTQFHLDFDILILLFLLIVVVLATSLALRDPRRYLALAISHLALVASIMVVALLRETRVMLELVPFVALGVSALREQRAA